MIKRKWVLFIHLDDGIKRDFDDILSTRTEIFPTSEAKYKLSDANLNSTTNASMNFNPQEQEVNHSSNKIHRTI